MKIIDPITIQIESIDQLMSWLRDKTDCSAMSDDKIQLVKFNKFLKKFNATITATYTHFDKVNFKTPKDLTLFLIHYDPTE
jgi:hypothetical protein